MPVKTRQRGAILNMLLEPAIVGRRDSAGKGACDTRRELLGRGDGLGKEARAVGRGVVATGDKVVGWSDW